MVVRFWDSPAIALTPAPATTIIALRATPQAAVRAKSTIEPNHDDRRTVIVSPPQSTVAGHVDAIAVRADCVAFDRITANGGMRDCSTHSGDVHTALYSRPTRASR